MGMYRSDRDQNRSTLERLLDVLSVVEGYGEMGAKKSRIVYEANLGWGEKMNYELDFLIAYNFMGFNEKGNVYYLKEKGMRALSYFKPLKKMFTPEIVKKD